MDYFFVFVRNQWSIFFVETKNQRFNEKLLLNEILSYSQKNTAFHERYVQTFLRIKIQSILPHVLQMYNARQKRNLTSQS